VSIDPDNFYALKDPISGIFDPTPRNIVQTPF
jgi:hypothetical protein